MQQHLRQKDPRMTTLHQRRLARELRTCRETAGFCPETVARAFGWDRSKVSRLETAKVKPKKQDVAALLDLYGITDDRRDALLLLVEYAQRRGWWAAFGDAFDGTYVAHEDGAARILCWEAQLIPGLLQTEDYARAVISAVRPGDPEGVQQRVRGRIARQPVLGRDNDPPQFHAVIGEAALRQRAGGVEVMRAQLAELLVRARRPNITVQVLPFAAGAHPGVDGSFVILEFPDDPALMYVESQAGDTYLRAPDQRHRLKWAWDGVRGAALTPVESEEFLTDLIGGVT